MLELAQRIKALEEAFGVSATAVAAAAPAGGGGGGGGADEEAEEQTAFTVHLAATGDKKIQVIKVVRAATGLGLKEAKALVDEAPKDVKEGVDREEADRLKQEAKRPARRSRSSSADSLKIIAPEISSNERVVARFQREMKLVGRLDHPNVVRAFDADQINQVLYIVMEYVSGMSLGERLKKRARSRPPK